MINLFLPTEWSEDGNVIDLATISEENVNEVFADIGSKILASSIEY